MVAAVVNGFLPFIIYAVAVESCAHPADGAARIEHN